MPPEAEFVRWLNQRLVPRADVLLGIGDDAAVLRGDRRDWVITTDMLCDGVHFRWGEASPEQIGHKLMGVNLSDMAAMSAVPRAAVVSVAWPRDFTLDAAQRLYEGMLKLADEFNVALIGGDTNSWSQPLVVSVTMWGNATNRGVLRRDGAQVGDRILVTGKLGGSLLSHHLDFTPRVRESLDLHARYTLHAGMDITDGLSIDLARLTTASAVGAELDLAAIPVAPDAFLCSQTSGRSPLEHALSDGEDFELLLTAPPEEASRILVDTNLDCAVHDVGQIIKLPGLWTLDPSGQRRAIEPQGYLH